MKIKTKTKILSEKFFSNFKIIIFGLTLFSGAAYLVVINHTNTMGIEIAEMQLTINQLNDQRRDLENQATQLQSMQRIEAISNAELSMVQAQTYSYLSDQAGSLAVRGN